MLVFHPMALQPAHVQVQPTATFYFPSQYSKTIPFQSTFSPVVLGNIAVDVVCGGNFLMEWFGNIHVLVCKQDCEASARQCSVSGRVFGKAVFQSGRTGFVFSHCQDDKFLFFKEVEV